MPPIVRVAPTMKFAPRIVTSVPPTVGPVLGSMLESNHRSQQVSVPPPPRSVELNSPIVLNSSCLKLPRGKHGDARSMEISKN